MPDDINKPIKKLTDKLEMQAKLEEQRDAQLLSALGEMFLKNHKLAEEFAKGNVEVLEKTGNVLSAEIKASTKFKSIGGKEGVQQFIKDFSEQFQSPTDTPDDDDDKKKVGDLKTAQAIQAQAKNLTTTIGGHVRDVLGDLNEVVEFAKTSFSNMGSFVKGIGEDLGIFKKEDDKAKPIETEISDRIATTNELLQSALNAEKERFKKEKKSKFRKGVGEDDDGGLMDIIATGIAGVFIAISTVIGTFVGGLVGPIFAPFLAIGAIIAKMPKLGFIAKIWKTAVQFFTEMPILGHFFKALRTGFKWIGIPITIIMGVIDFFKGFAATEGSLFEKIKGGFTVMIIRFLELPIRLLGWVLEKLGLEDATAKIVGVAKGFIGVVFNYFKFIFGIISSVFGGIVKVIQMLPWDFILAMIKNVGSVLASIFGGIWDFIKNSTVFKWLAKKFGAGVSMEVDKDDLFGAKSLTEGIEEDKTKKGLFDFEMPKLDFGASPSTQPGGVATLDSLSQQQLADKKGMRDEDKERAEEIAKENKKLRKTLEKLQKGQQEQTAVAIQNTERVIAETGAEEPPDFIDKAGILLVNMGLT